MIIPAIRSAMETGDCKYCWEEVMAELLPLIYSPLTSDVEMLLLEIIRFDGRLRIIESHNMPHSMSPIDMLKSLAVQAIAKWTGFDHLQDILKLQKTTQSSSLASLVNDVISRT